MAVYTIHEPPAPPADLIERAEALEFVRDGFTWNAAIVPPLYFLSKKMWAEALAYVAAMTVGICVLLLMRFSPSLVFVLIAAAHIWIGFEAVDLQREAMARAGWRMLGSVSGGNQAECERRFFDSWLGGDQTVAASGDTAMSAPAAISLMGDLEQRLKALLSRLPQAKT